MTLHIIVLHLNTVAKSCQKILITVNTLAVLRLTSYTYYSDLRKCTVKVSER